MIDAVPMPPFFALASQIYRPAPHMLELNWAPLVGALVVTKRAWDRIPEATRPQMILAAQRAGAEIQEAGRRESDEAVETMRAEGAVVIDPTDIPHMDNGSVFSELPARVLNYEFKAGIAAYLESLGPDAPVKTLEEIVSSACSASLSCFEAPSICFAHGVA